MKKIVLTIGIIILIGVLFSSLMPNKKSLLNNGFKSKKEMKYISYDSVGDYINGYFYIKDEQNIMYFDYNTKKEVFLCNKPNCKHVDETCSSYLTDETNELFFYNDYLYLISGDSAGTSMIITENGVEENDYEGSPSTITRINLDGTNKKKVFVAPSGTSLSTPIAVNENTIYGFLEKSKTESTGSKSKISKVIERKLVAINLETGKYKEISDGMYKNLIGVYDNKLVVQEIDYLKDPDSFGNNTKAFINNLYNSKTTIKLVDIKTNDEKIVFEGLFKEIEMLKFYKDGIYFTSADNPNLEYINFNTQNREVIAKLPKNGFEILKIIDDKVLVYNYNYNYNNRNEDAYFIDLKTKKLCNFDLKDTDGHVIDILASNNQYYFVRTETIFGDEYTTWAGTKQRDTIGTNYALITKDNYWNSKPDFIKMTSSK